MTAARIVSGMLLAVAVGAGTAADGPRKSAPLILDGYRVVAADFHTHSSLWSGGSLTPWGLVLEAQRQGLDAVAITGHNLVLEGKVGRWFTELVGGPTILVGQEIGAVDHHVVAVGIERVVNWRLSAADQIAAIHAQGGIAIAAHPIPRFWPGFDENAVRRLDGTEMCHPLSYGDPATQAVFERFASRGTFAPIGSSDFHWAGRMGMCRTYVFARDTSAPAILDAVRARRTVVYAPPDKVYGDPELVRLAAGHPRLREAAIADAPVVRLDSVSRIFGVLGLFGLIVCGTPRSESVA